MPSGARKRKASKKKGKNGEAQSSNNSRTSSSSNSSSTHSQGLDDRESDSGEIEREEEVEIVDHGKGLSDEIAEITKEVKSEKIDTLGVDFGAFDVPKETPISVPSNGGLQDKQVTVDYGKGLSDEIAEISKEAKSEKIDTLGVVFGSVDVAKETPISSPSNGGLQDKQVAVDYGKGLSDEIIAEITKEAKSEKIETLGMEFGAVAVPKETPISSPSNVISLPQETNVGLGSSVASDLVESKLIKKDLALQNSDVNENFSSSLKGPRSEKTEGEIVSKDEDKSVVAPPVDFKPLETKKQLEEQLVDPAVTVRTSVVQKSVKNKEIQTRSTDQTLIGSNPISVRRTSWMGCCGLFELFSGANR